MPSPFYNAIKGTTSGTPGTGAFTPSAAASGFRAWSNVPAGWVGLVRYDDGTDWELRYGYWNATTITRGSNSFHSSSTGSGLTLTSSATAAMIADAMEIMPHLGGVPWRGWFSVPNNATMTSVGVSGLTTTGTAAAAALATTNFLTEQPRTQVTMATTTANSQAGWSGTNIYGIYSTSTGRGGAEFSSRWGLSVLGVGPRLFIGATSTTWIANTAEPSAHTANTIIFGKDSTDTNIQFITNAAASGSGTKTDTGIALAANGWYESTVWWEPGGGKASGLLYRLDTGEIWYGSTATDLPANGALMLPLVTCGIATAGTAAVIQPGSLVIRSGT